MLRKSRFTVTEDHLKLMRRMNVGWQEAEFGAPEINPKRPYGNSSVLNDIHEILTGESIDCANSLRDELTDEEEDRYRILHKQTETALQVCLATGAFVVGTFEAEEYRENWVAVH